MNKASNKIYQHLPILTLVGGDQQSCEKILIRIAPALASTSIDILVVFCGTDTVAQKSRVRTLLDTPYDTVFIDREVETDGIVEEGKERINGILSQYYNWYDLIILCKTDISGSKKLHLFEGLEQQREALFRLNADADTVPLITCLNDWLSKQLMKTPVWGCVLIGGKSSRMGRPKHLIENAGGVTWGEKIVHTLSEHTERVVLSGGGDIPQSLTHLERMADIPGAQGPLAGILAAMRWNPHVSFIVAACDMPGIHKNSLHWLLNRRRPGVWGTVPLHPQTQRFEPLFALYDFRSRLLFEQLLQKGSLRPNHVCKNDKIETPTVPAIHADSWRNCNTPADLTALQGDILDSEVTK